MISIQYRRNEIIKKIAIVQLVPVVFIFYGLSAALGKVRVDKPEILGLAFLAAVAIYLVIMKFMINALNDPIVLRILDNGDIRWRPALRNLDFKASPGTLVDVTRNEISISPPVPGIPATKSTEHSTVFTIPGNTDRPPTSQFRIIA